MTHAAGRSASGAWALRAKVGVVAIASAYIRVQSSDRICCQMQQQCEKSHYECHA